MIQVKICGLSDAAGFDAAIAAGADWVGFVFFPASPRFVTVEQAASLSARSPGGAPRVGLFVEPTLDDIDRVLGEVRLDVLQVYGSVSALPAIRACFELPLWRARGIASAADLPTDRGGADAWLLEAKPPPQSTRPGGNAVSLDWSVLSGWQAPGQWLLAGGLTPENVAEAVHVTEATAVDVSSGVESRRGVKDPVRIRDFIARAKAAA